MPLIALRASDGAEIEAFSVDPAEWDVMRMQPRGAFAMIGTNWPAVLKRSIRGTQFFAHASGYQGVRPEPESEQHLLAKVMIARGLRADGYTALVECPGISGDGDSWGADVLCETNGRRIAFEVQLAQQTLEQYEGRTAAYARSGVECVWLVRAPGHYGVIAKAIYYRLREQGIRPPSRPSLSLPHLAALPFELGSAKSAEIQDMTVTVFPAAGHRRISLAEFAVGVAMGRLNYSECEWRWHTTSP
jgi:hypothetical protein